MTAPTKPLTDFESSASHRFLHDLCCPLCLNSLQSDPPLPTEERVTKGALVCVPCKETYPIHEGIPDLFREWPLGTTAHTHPFPATLLTPGLLKEHAKKTKADQIVLTGPIDPRGFFHTRNRQRLTLIRGLLWLGLIISFATFSSILAVTCLLGFLADFWVLATSKQNRYRHELAQLLVLAEKGILHEKDITQGISNAAESEPEESADDRAIDMERFLPGADFQNKEVLHVGCGGENEAGINHFFLNHGARLVGLDVYVPGLKTFKQRFQSDAVLSEALRMPFGSGRFDFTNCTDIIEHVHDPYRFLQENCRVLRPGGRMLVLTPNRTRARKDLGFINPFVFMQGILGGVWPSLLSARELMCRHLDFIFYHTSFSQKELEALLIHAGFEVEQSGIKAYRGPLKGFRKKLENIPFLRTLNDSVVVVARKPHP